MKNLAWLFCFAAMACAGCLPEGGDGGGSSQKTCLLDRECGDGESCDVETRTCYTPGSCAVNADCRARCLDLSNGANGTVGMCECAGASDTSSCRPTERCTEMGMPGGGSAFVCFPLPSQCTRDSECARGTICGSSATCEAQSCQSKADCGPNRTCIPEEGRCTGVECTFAEDCDQVAGESCDQGLCVEGGTGGCSSREDCAATNQVCNLLTSKCVAPPANCSSDNDCVSPRSCDSVTRVCSSGATACATDGQCSTNQYCDTGRNECRDGCRSGGCDEGLTCDFATRACVPIAICTASECEADGGKACDPKTGRCVERTGSVTLCGACTAGSTTECGAPGVDRCTPLGPDSGRCVYSCQEPTDCPSGFSCIQLTASPEKFCAPLNGFCQGCLIDGCPSNQVCNPNGACTAPKALCEECAPGLCATGTDCVQFAGAARCLDLCDGGCPTGSTCDTSANVCKPDNGSCQAAACPGVTCSGATPYLDEQTCACVTCLDSSQCGGNQCVSGACTSCACPPGTTCQGDQCVPTGSGCTSCSGNAYCDTVTRTCYTPGSCTTDADCRTRCSSLGVCVCTGESDTVSCRADEVCSFNSITYGCTSFGGSPTP